MITLLVAVVLAVGLALMLGDRWLRWERSLGIPVALVAGGLAALGGMSFVGILASGQTAVDSLLRVASAQSATVVDGTDKSAPHDAHAREQDERNASRTPTDPLVPDELLDSDRPLQASAVVVDIENRPDWVESDPLKIGQVHTIPVTAGPELRPQDAREQLKVELKQAVDRYVDDLLGQEGAARIVDFPTAYIETQLLKPENVYSEVVLSPSFGRVHQVHALLEFSPQFRQEAQHRWNEAVVARRLAGVAVLGGGVMALVLVLFSYFRLDTATRGFYTGRLQFATAVAILAVVAAGVLVVREITWW